MGQGFEVITKKCPILLINETHPGVLSLQDGFLLAHLLGQTDVSKDNVSIALQLYDDTRRPFSQKIAALSFRSGQLNHLDTPEFAHITAEESASGKAFTPEQLQGLWRQIEEVRSWSSRKDSSVLEETKHAVQRLVEALAVVRQ